MGIFLLSRGTSAHSEMERNMQKYKFMNTAAKEERRMIGREEEIKIMQISADWWDTESTG